VLKKWFTIYKHKYRRQVRFKEKLSNSEIEENEDELYWKRYYNFRDVRNKQPKKSILKKSKFIIDKT